MELNMLKVLLGEQNGYDIIKNVPDLFGIYSRAGFEVSLENAKTFALGVANFITTGDEGIFNYVTNEEDQASLRSFRRDKGFDKEAKPAEHSDDLERLEDTSQDGVQKNDPNTADIKKADGTDMKGLILDGNVSSYSTLFDSLKEDQTITDKVEKDRKKENIQKLIGVTATAATAVGTFLAFKGIEKRIIDRRSKKKAFLNGVTAEKDVNDIIITECYDDSILMQVHEALVDRHDKGAIVDQAFIIDTVNSISGLSAEEGTVKSYGVGTHYFYIFDVRVKGAKDDVVKMMISWSNKYDAFSVDVRP